MNTSVLFAQEKTTIMYIGDPMCSWCYGFSPEISEIKSYFSDYDFKIVLGGLRPHGKEQINEMKSFLQSHWEQVNSITNQPFSYAILDEKELVYDTEPACRAVVAARTMNKDIDLDFFKNIQIAFYSKNLNTNMISTYLSIAQKYNLDLEKYKDLYLSNEIKDQTIEDFNLASKIGIKGFPAVILSYNNKLYFVCNGYMPAKKVIKNIERIIN